MSIAVVKFSKTKFIAILQYAFFFICLLPVSIYAFKRPHYNWDILPYMAIIIKMEQPSLSIENVHHAVYENAKKNIPQPEYGYLTDSSSAYRLKMLESPVDFHGQSAFYVVKPLYTGLAYLFYKAGIPLPRSTVMPSILSFLLMGLLLFHWIKKYLSSVFAFAAGLLIMYSTFMVSVLRASTPDCLSAVLIFTAFYFILEKRSPVYMLIFFMLAIFARIDNIVTTILILSFLAFAAGNNKKISIWRYGSMVLLLVACYLTVTMVFGPEGWGSLYYPKFVQHYDLSHKVHESFSLNAYLALLYSKAITGMVFSHFTLFMFLWLLLFYPLAFRRFSFDQQVALLITVIIFTRFILFPDISDRFNIAFYLVIIILLVKKISNLDHRFPNSLHA